MKTLLKCVLAAVYLCLAVLKFLLVSIMLTVLNILFNHYLHVPGRFINAFIIIAVKSAAFVCRCTASGTNYYIW